MIVLYNPLSTTPGKQPLPLSLMSLAAVLGDEHAWSLVDGNLVPDPAAEIVARLDAASASAVKLLAVTVMPGPQLTQAVAVCRRVKAELPDVPIVWGGYFPTQHADTVLASPLVDFVVRSQGEQPLLQLLAALRSGGSLARVTALSWKAGTSVIHNSTGALTPLDDLPDLPYDRVDMTRYLHRNYLGRRTVAYNSSFGCPFACSFCAVVAMSNRRWIAQSPARMERALRGPRRHLRDRRRPDARHGLLHLRGAYRGVCGAHREARRCLVGAGTYRHAHAVQRRDVAEDGAIGPEDGVLGRRSRQRRDARGDEQGRQGVVEPDARARPADADLRCHP